MRLSGLLFVATLSSLPALLRAQETPPDTAARGEEPALRIRLRRDSLFLERPAPLLPFGRLSPLRQPAEFVAESRGIVLQRSVAMLIAAQWGQTTSSAFAGIPSSGATPVEAREIAAEPAAPLPPRPEKTDIFGQYADLGLQMHTRIEAKAERNKNDRCAPIDLLTPVSNCAGSFQPQFDFQFNVRSGGVVADRIHVNVDYDSEREFDASNNISVYYEGKQDEMLHRLEVGNVSFAPAPSRFITAGIPSGNYGLQAVGQLGPMSFRTIMAQQKGNVVKDRVFTVGDRTVQTIDREIEDFQLERRRFFWVIDPGRAFPDRFPNVDILDRDIEALAARIPTGERPRRVLLYRYRPPTASGSVARDINGPYAHTRFARNANEIGPFEVLQEGIDYFVDPSGLWIALVNPIQRGERLAVSFTVTGADGREAIVGAVGGTFPTERGPAGRDTVNLLWDNDVLPGDAVFDREIRSVYRLGGDDIQRNTVSLKIVVGSGNDQEKPAGSTLETFLQMFGLAQPSNTSAFDMENRLWPRLGDPNLARNAGAGDAKLIRDYFVVFPSLRPFADSGLAEPPNPVNDSLYRTPDEDLSSSRRSPTQYRIRARYSAEGGGDAGSLTLGSVQVRQNSERLLIDGIPLTRDTDYRVDYELGRVTFTRPDTLFARPRRVTVQYEENPLFAAAPTSIFGLAAEVPMEKGQLSFTAISQTQKTTFNRPPLGFEPASALVAGVSGVFNFESERLTRALDKLPFLQSSRISRIGIQGEFATSRPQPNAAGVAYIETFEGEGGIQINLSENVWRAGSRPFAPGGVLLGGRSYAFAFDSAATLAWQNVGLVAGSRAGVLVPNYWFAAQIDSQFRFTGGQAFRAPELLLWNTLYPSDIGGLLRERDGQITYRWRTRTAPGRRWRSITQSFGSSGVDLTRVEHIELWTLIDTRAENLARNPALVIDFGDLSENTVAFRPETLTVSAPGSGTADSSFTGRTLAGYDRLDTERDLDTRSFDAARNDRGLPGDRAETLVKKDAGSAQVEALSDVPLCDGGVAIAILGDTRHNCTVTNRRLDEEDLDLDGVLNMLGTENANERLLRYVVDLSDQRVFDRVGLCYRSPQDTTATGGAGRPFCWVRVRVPFASPRETIGDPLVRRIRTVRLTIVSGASSPDTFATIPIARMKLVGAPWLKRSERPLAGIAGALTAGSGYVVASVIGTQDRNAAAGLNYEPPPGISDQADDKSGEYAAGLIQVNEKSLRLLSGALSLYERAEAVYRFPEGEKNFMGYERLHVWARGRNKGWGPEGDLQFYIKIGRDADNFYLYRAPANAGNAREAWNPEQVVDFRKFYSLRTRIQNSFLRGGDSLSCSGLDSALVAASEPPVSSGGKRFVACDGGYIAYTSNPGVSPPNLAAVQELSVGMVRVATTGIGTGGPITPADTLELWVDDIRLRGVVNDAGYAGQLALALVAADVGTVNVKVSRRDSHFRQLAEQPTYATDNQLDIGSSFQLERFLPQRLGVAMPFTVNHASSGTDPVFLSRSDISGELLEGLRKPRTAATSFSLGVRRATPLVGGWYAPILNNVSLNSTYSSGRQRSEYQTGAAKSFTGSLDYNLAAGARSASLPRWLDRAIMHLPSFLRESDAVRSLRGASLRWMPSQLRFSSAYAHNTDRRSTFSRPVEFDGDTARQVTGLRSDWRNRGLVELRPFESLTARWDLNSVRDLRDYGDASDVAIVAGFERERFLGRDVGLERERQMQSVISFAPPFSSWIRPRLDLGTSYSMFRDPNSRNLVRSGAASDGELRLPRRLVNSQSLSAGASVDVGQAITRYAGDSGIARRIANVFQPLNVSWTRDLRSIYDGTPFTPPIGYQFALGGIGDFRSLEGVLATSAGFSRTLSADHGLSLPLGLNVVNRYSRSTSDSWTRRSVTSQSLLTASTVTFPDVNVRWNFQPALLKRILTSIGGQAGTAVSRSYIFQPIPGDATGGTRSGVRTEQETRRFPLNVSIAWGSGGGGAAGLSTTGSWMRTDRKELRSGGRTEGEQNDVSGELSRAFKLPASFNLEGNVFRGRLGFQRTSNDVFFLTDTARKRITDNSRWTINASADTEVTQNATFSLQLARTVNTDDVHDRRFTQMVLSAVLQLQFYSGELR